jgi:N-acetylmuramoyl-L-alanine amidase
LQKSKRHSRKGWRKNCLLVSIHNNAATGRASGWEIHTCLGKSKSDEYATIFWNEAKTILPMGTKMRGDWTDGDADWDSNFAILRDTKCAAVFTENLFMDNPGPVPVALYSRYHYFGYFGGGGHISHYGKPNR